MPSLKQTRQRIKSVRNTQKITKAMKMVSAAKLRRAQEAIESNRAYVDRLGEILSDIASRSDLSGHPLVGKREEEKKVLLVVISSDRGLAGSFNANILKAAGRAVEKKPADQQMDLLLVGKKARDYFGRRGFKNAESRLGLLAKPNPQASAELFGELVRRFRSGEVDAVHVAYSRFKSALTQFPTVTRLLPLDLHTDGVAVGEVGREMTFVDYLYEPGRDAVVESLLPAYGASLLHRMFLDAAAGEHGARMTAMDAATNNCKAMINKLTLQYNRTRQAMITKELIEIISGAEAL